MHKFILFIKEFRIYKKREMLDAIASFSKKQFLGFLTIIIFTVITIIIILAKINLMFMVSVPVNGGTITEGIIGVSTLVNPINSFSYADKDLTSLVYSGLMKKKSDGSFIPDIAESYTVSPDGLKYTFIIKDGLKFHNGDKITTDDIIFTIEKIKDPTIKSPRKLEWDGVSVEKISDFEVLFTLTEPYISFLDNTTIGILPSSLWQKISINEFNLSPLNNTKAIGSGPYKIKSVTKNDDGIPIIYKLERFDRFSLGKPLIKNIKIVSYTSEKDLLKALLSHSIDQAGGINPESAENIKKNDYTIHEITLPKIFGIFFNKSKNEAISDPSVVKALDLALDRQMIVDEVLNGYGSIIHNPIPEKFLKDESIEQYKNPKIEEANNILEKAGWIKGEDGIRKKGGVTTKTTTSKVGGKTVTKTTKTNTPEVRLAFSLTTGDTSDFKKTTELIKEQLKKVGVEVNEKIYETGQLNQLIKDRDYEALLFGQFINHESNLYSYWHSSQAKDPGLNIGMYNNKKVDTILESIQKTLETESRLDKYVDLAEEFNNNTSALLIYSPIYIYATSPNLNNYSFENITVSSDRFNSVYEWAADTDKVWKIFTK